MQDIFDTRLLRARRARAAAAALGHDFLLRHAIEEIAFRLNGIRRDFAVAADIGAQGGALARALAAVPSVGMIVSCDTVPEMLAQAPMPRVLADAAMLPFAHESLDLIVSAFTLHLVNDLPGALVQMRRALRPDGLLLACVLGGDTLHELRASLMQAELEMTGGASPRVAPMADVRDYGALLQRAGFALPVVDADRLVVTYADIFALMRDLRGMGATNMLAERARRPVGRRFFARAGDIYRERFPAAGGRIAATYEIITLTGWAPHESQQKPLAPGSAAARLADALGVPEHAAGDKAAFPLRSGPSGRDE